MTLDQVREIIDQNIELITVDARGLAESRERAAKFLTVVAILANYLKDLEIEIGKYSATVEASFAQAMRESDGKNVTEKKAFAEENPLYSKNKVAMSQFDAQRNWIKTYMKIFENAHLMFRQYSRE